ncbi:MAG: AAA family ATPase [Sulfurovum sp.]|nr:MAG: AAA family ATPase [Sulfurovum sp.]
MESLYLKNFKAYRDEFEKLNVNKKNFLLYGENGSGKSSLYEAIKITFFREKIAENIPMATTPEEQSMTTDSFWNSYKNNKATEPFEVTINDISYRDFDATSYQLFMIAMDKLCIKGTLQLDKLLTKIDVNIDDIGAFCSAHFSEIESTVNLKLAEFHEENITIVIDNEDDYKIKIHDTVRNLEFKENVTHYFNEAKLNLIVLLLLLESIKKSQQSDKTKILVLDDFITSLDVSNRTFLMRYILEDFSEFQILILTHNVYFYNLIMYLVNDIYKTKAKWQFANLYEIGNEHKIYINPSKKKRLELDTLATKLESLTEATIETSGNEFRQKFEILLYEFSKILMVGGVEDTKNILNNIMTKNKIYLFKDGNQLKGSLELLEELEKIINSGTTNIQDVKTAIDKYSHDNLTMIKTILRDLKLYQKVHLHHLSHGHIDEINFSIKEANATLNLLKKLETNIKDLTGNSVN